MSNYTEVKHKMDIIRGTYACAGDLIFRAAIQMVVECGQYTLLNDEWYDAEMAKFEANKSWHRFEKAIYKCARQLATVNSADFLMYIQKEVWLGDHNISYPRMVELLHSCMNWFVDYDCCETKEMLKKFKDLGFADNELTNLGFNWLFEEEDE